MLTLRQVCGVVVMELPLSVCLSTEHKTKAGDSEADLGRGKREPLGRPCVVIYRRVSAVYGDFSCLDKLEIWS